jgi:hypothetical protein
MIATSVGSIAVTVAERGSWSIADNSPNISPGRMIPSVTSRPAGEKVTAAAAPLSTKNTSRVRLPLSSRVSALA